MLYIPGRIPIIIHPAFWIFAALIGYVNSLSLIGTLVWIAVIFISVLFHEFGHAITAFMFNQKPRIELVALGGLTYHEGKKLKFGKQFLIVFNGPFFGFILFGIATFLLQYPALQQGNLGLILRLLQGVNLFWTICNLLPVFPLDGGQLLRIILEAIWGVKGIKYSLITSIVIALVCSLLFFLMQGFFIGSLLFLLAFQSYDTYRKSRAMTSSDRNQKLHGLLEKIEATTDKKAAMDLCEKVRIQAKSGMIFNQATEYLAFLCFEQELYKQVYDLLLPIQKEISNEALCLLHKAAFDQKDFSLVTQIGAQCFQSKPHPDIAIRNACASAALNEPTAAVGWLKTAIDEGVVNIQSMLTKSIFDPIRQDPLFQELLHVLSKEN
ncbi:site-2 protease family protein [Candidatus Rhabdochlamydia sp. T3358]|uniref:site-2 protease family protein n=1 Tax=Candidatus Rhabdochlamydia sp. T3358 TaxID=2099795 RepID=UPI0010BBBBE0|nr:site-2 protease family protein [Candidatus Rhabdochlamydia sp. T3358]VHO02123.1 Stage IV sporulation protein FB [Candidatus Rhabdochlamydia sp. T3358]